jgi:hypothetical protein
VRRCVCACPVAGMRAAARARTAIRKKGFMDGV